LLDHFAFELEAQQEQAAQRLPRLVLGPGLVSIFQAGVDCRPVGRIDAAEGGIVEDFVIKLAHLLAVVFEAAHLCIVQRPALGSMRVVILEASLSADHFPGLLEAACRASAGFLRALRSIVRRHQSRLSIIATQDLQRAASQSRA
jgi:hypothetical protein